MRYLRACAALALTTCLLFAAPAILRAAAPEPLPQKTFDVRVEGGTVEVTFALALSEISTYPVKITAVSGSVEEVLWQGQLSEGLYRLRAPLTKITSGPLKLVLKTQMTNRNSRGGDTYDRYLVWEGTVSR